MRPAAARGVRFIVRAQLYTFTCKSTDKWELRGGVSPRAGYEPCVHTACLPCVHAQGAGAHERGLERGGAVERFCLYCSSYKSEYPQVTCCNLCLSAAEMIFPELLLAPSQTRFQEMVTRQNMECFYARGVENCECRGGCGVHVPMGCDPVLCWRYTCLCLRRTGNLRRHM